MRHLLLLASFFGSTPALAGGFDHGPKLFARPVGPEPAEHHHGDLEPPGDAYRKLGVASSATGHWIQPLPHTQDAGIEAFVRELESTTYWAGAVRPRLVQNVVVVQADGTVVPVYDDPRGWRAALAAWSRTRNDSFGAAWTLASFHLNSCVDRDRHDPPESPNQLEKAEASALPATIDLSEAGGLLSYTWWTRGGRTATIQVPLDGSAACPARLSRR